MVLDANFFLGVSLRLCGKPGLTSRKARQETQKERHHHKNRTQPDKRPLNRIQDLAVHVILTENRGIIAAKPHCTVISDALDRLKNEAADGCGPIDHTDIGSGLLLHSRDHVCYARESAQLFHLFTGDVRRILDTGEAQAEFVRVCRTTQCLFERDQAGLI